MPRPPGINSSGKTVSQTHTDALPAAHHNLIPYLAVCCTSDASLSNEGTRWIMLSAGDCPVRPSLFNNKHFLVVGHPKFCNYLVFS